MPSTQTSTPSMSESKSIIFPWKCSDALLKQLVEHVYLPQGVRNVELVDVTPLILKLAKTFVLAGNLDPWNLS